MIGIVSHLTNNKKKQWMLPPTKKKSGPPNIVEQTATLELFLLSLAPGAPSPARFPQTVPFSRTFYFKSNSFSSEGFNKNLHTTT